MNGQTHGGKGSTQRPMDKKKFDQNFDTIFNVKKDKKKENKA